MALCVDDFANEIDHLRAPCAPEAFASNTAPERRPASKAA
jgi:hypothetical protein